MYLRSLLQGFLKGGEESCSSGSSLTLDSDQEPGPSSSMPDPQDSEMTCSSSATGSGGVALLDSSITQFNSDEEDSD